MRFYKQKKSTRLYIKQLLMVAALFIFIVSAKSIMDFLNTEEPQQLAETLSESFRMYDDRTVEITKYELFYRDPSLYTKEAVEFTSLYETIEKYALFYHLEKFDYKWDEERRNGFRERLRATLDYDMKNENLKTYYDKMFAELQITEEEYIEYYLLVNKEYEILHQEMFDKSIGLDENGYPIEDTIMAYQELIGLPENYLNDLAEKDPEPLEPLAPQPELPYNTENFELKVTTNEQGEYIFVQSSRFYFFISPVYRDFLSDFSYRILKEDLTRFSFERHQIALKNFHSEDAQQMKIAKEVASILEILERTIEMEYDFTAAGQ